MGNKYNIGMTDLPQYNRVKFLKLNEQARSNALKQMAKINNQAQLQDASTAEQFAELIVNGYNPDRDYMFLQYPGDSPDKVTAHLQDFS